MLNQIFKDVFKTKSEKYNDSVNEFKIIRKDGSEIIKFRDLKDAEEFSNLINNLYKENNIKDEAKVISCN